MVSVALPPFSSLKWPSALKFPDEIAANFESLITICCQLSAFFRSDSGVSIISFIIYSAGTFLAITLPACIFLYSNRKKKINKPFIPAANFEIEVNEYSSEKFTMGPMDEDEFFRGITDERGSAADAVWINEVITSDADYAEEIQIQETLLASILTSAMPNSPSSSFQQPIFNTELVNLEKEAENPPQSFCEICLDDKENWQMFTNDKCSHSFCYECTAKHIITKIQDKVKEIACPSLNCCAPLNFEACRLIIPDEALIQWDELLCLSLIPESQKLYCPFRDCLAMLVNESGGAIREIQCLACKRSFCGECHVPWHSDFSCKEFQKLYAKKRGKEDKIVKLLAKKKSWQKCPKCKMYVEKTEGCVHITCRCGYEFCYRCGGKWSNSHGNCKPKS